ncbi:hypothetical protein F444_20921, partial [Phytophthora nicotianae P1976]
NHSGSLVPLLLSYLAFTFLTKHSDSQHAGELNCYRYLRHHGNIPHADRQPMKARSAKLHPHCLDAAEHLPLPYTMSERAERLSGLQNGAVGSIAGMIEVMLQQPTVAIKNAVQQGRPIPWSVPALYRGVGVSLASIAPVSAIQFAVNGRLLRGLTDPTSAPSDQTKVLCGTLSGVASAVLSAPAELVMTLQQNNGKSFGATVKEVAQQHGVVRLLRGFSATAVRDAVWCAGYLALGPVFTREMHILSPATFGDVNTATKSQKASASIAGCVTAGLITVAATQPVDTIKTVMQGEAMVLPSGRIPSTLATACRIYREGGLARFYRGIVPRGCRLVGAVFILGQSRIKLEEVFEEHELLKI